MKLTLFSLLLATTSALCAPTTLKGSIKLTELRASSSQMSQTSTMHFKLTDPNYPHDTPTECNLIWPYGSNPDANARCNNGQYYIKFPHGLQDLGKFTLQLQRVKGAIPEKGKVLLNENKPGSKWKCVENPREGVTERCVHDGPLEVQVVFT